MYKLSYKTYFLISLIISILLSLSPLLVLIEHHSWLDIIDKNILLFTAFFITFLNLIFQNRLQSKSFSYAKNILFTFLFNCFLFSINLLIRIPFWSALSAQKPPLAFFILVDLVRSIIIALVAIVVISFLIKNSIQMAYKTKISALENQTLQLQLKTLTAQLQPHFFFNSLNILSELIFIDTKKSEDYIQHLSNIFRYVLTNQDTPIIPLTDEINFIKSYLFLLKIRFENEISIDYDLCNEETYTVPSLCSLIVLENIVKHNNINNIRIKISLSDNSQLLKISNSKNKKNRIEVKSMGLGLANINKKCDLLLQRSIKVNETEDIFEIEIPLNKVS